MNPTQTIPTGAVAAPTYERSRALRERANALIPGGCHTYAKSEDRFPEFAPLFIERGKGCRVWDVDGNEYIEYAMGMRSVTLGHAFEPVVEAAHRAMLAGSNFTRPAPLEVECAEELLGVITRADMVKFAKNGSDVTTAAVRLARACTGRDIVAVCADHPFFSINDWYIGTTAMAAGVPHAVRQLTVGFHYNDLASVRRLFEEHPGRIACVILEPAKYDEPENGFLHGLRRLCSQEGALLILDEMITGFRWHLGGAQEVYGVTPDLSTFGKALGNGFAVAALAGRREIMRRGGLAHREERVFLLSLTHGAETHALAAALETIRTYRRENVVERLYRQGGRLRAGLNQAIRENGLEGAFEVIGRPCNLVYVARDEFGEVSPALHTLFLQETIKRGVIAPSFVVSAAHTDADIDRTIEASVEALRVYRKALDEGVGKYLVGRSIKPIFRRYN